MGKWIAKAGFLPDRILCSAARRTRETIELVRDAPGWQDHDPEITYSDDLYLASPHTVLEMVEATGDEFERIMVVGHNPAMDQVLVHFCPEARPTASGKLMTTAAAAVIDISPGEESRLLELIRPMDL